MRVRLNPIFTRGSLKRAVVYHGSHSGPERMQAFIRKEFKALGAGSTYGAGIYTVLEMNPNLPTFTGAYGPYVYRMTVNTSRFLAFTTEGSIALFGEVLPLTEQARRIGVCWPRGYDIMPIPADVIDEEEGRTASASAVSARDWYEMIRGSTGAAPDGILFYGRQDGPVAVIYNSAVIQLTGHARAEDIREQLRAKAHGSFGKISASRAGLLQAEPASVLRLTTKTDIREAEHYLPEVAALRWILRGEVSPSRAHAAFELKPGPRPISPISVLSDAGPRTLPALLPARARVALTEGSGTFLAVQDNNRTLYWGSVNLGFLVRSRTKDLRRGDSLPWFPKNFLGGTDTDCAPVVCETLAALARWGGELYTAGPLMATSELTSLHLGTLNSSESPLAWVKRFPMFNAIAVITSRGVSLQTFSKTSPGRRVQWDVRDQLVRELELQVFGLNGRSLTRRDFWSSTVPSPRVSLVTADLRSMFDRANAVASEDGPGSPG